MSKKYNALACIGRSFYNHHSNYTGEFMKANLLILFIFITKAAFAQSLAQEMYKGDCTPDRKYCVYFAPDNVPIYAVANYLKMAKKSIKIATYNLNVEEYYSILKQKIEQGIQVEFLVDYKLSFGSNSVWSKLPTHKNLKKYRVPVFRGGNPQMHNKLIIIDNQVLLTGSANYTYSGLLGNYENVMAIFDPNVIKKFNDEYQELFYSAQTLCQTFGNPTQACGSANENYPKELHQFLTTGSFPVEAIKNQMLDQCQGLTKGWGLLNNKNQPATNTIQDCFNDPRYSNLINLIAKKESYSDGVQVQADLKRTENKFDKYETQTLFSPEDNVEDAIISTLRSTLLSPQKSFAYVSTNFITNTNIAKTLVELNKAGVRTRIFFDRGRYEDPNFQNALKLLNPLITIFDNQLSGPYGCNHNKMAVVGTPENGLTLINGSANWSVGAMRKNDENLMLFKNPFLSAIYLKEILSQLFIYRYNQNFNDPQFKEEVQYLSRYTPYLNMLLGIEDSVQTPHGKWQTRPLSHAIISLNETNANFQTEDVWVWVKQLNQNKGGFLKLFTYDTFAGKWVTSIPTPINWEIEFKFLTGPKGHDPNTHGTGPMKWEFPGVQNRKLKVAPIAVQVIKENYFWGRP